MGDVWYEKQCLSASTSVDPLLLVPQPTESTFACVVAAVRSGKGGGLLSIVAGKASPESAMSIERDRARFMGVERRGGASGARC